MNNSKTVPPTDGDPIDMSYSDAEIRAYIYKIWNNIYNTDFYKQLDSDIRTAIHIELTNVLKIKISKIKKGEKLGVNLIQSLLDCEVKKAKEAKQRKEHNQSLANQQAPIIGTPIIPTQSKKVEQLKNIRQQIVNSQTTEEEMEEDNGMSM